MIKIIILTSLAAILYIVGFLLWVQWKRKKTISLTGQEAKADNNINNIVTESETVYETDKTSEQLKKDLAETFQKFQRQERVRQLAMQAQRFGLELQPKSKNDKTEGTAAKQDGPPDVISDEVKQAYERSKKQDQTQDADYTMEHRSEPDRDEDDSEKGNGDNNAGSKEATINPGVKQETKQEAKSSKGERKTESPMKKGEEDRKILQAPIFPTN